MTAPRKEGTIPFVACCRRGVCGVLLASLAAPASFAQIIRGTVIDEGSSQPIFAALIVVLDTADARVAGAISDDSGRFALRVRNPGRYTLGVERIGYKSGTRLPIEIGEGVTLYERLVASSIPIVLPKVDVNGASRCVVRPAVGLETAAIWEEARKALYAAQFALDEGMVTAIRRRYRKILDPTGAAVRREGVLVDTVVSAHVWSSPKSPDELARDGYRLGDMEYVGPDADVLLSNSFAETHCFNVARDSVSHPGLVGLAFAPARRRSVPELTGVIWVDSATAALRFVEFRHVNAFPDVSPRKYGGRVDFERLPAGVWIVRRWYIRLPMEGSASNDAAGGGDMRYMGGGRNVPGFVESGGEVLSATVAPASPP